MTLASQLTGWIPARVSWREAEPLIDWCYRGEQRISGNFEQTLNKCLELPFNLLFRHQTSMEVLRQVAEARPGIRPTGFIFHASRSYSALLMQWLAALPANIVLSEARPIDSLLRAGRFKSSVTDAERVEWVQLMVNNLAQPSGGERCLFIKFHCWSIFDLPIIRLAFPEVPWIFIYCDPIDELASQMAQRDAHMIPGVIDPQIFGMDPAAVSELAPEEYCARVLKAIFEAALQSLPDGGILINSAQMPAGFSTISGFFGLSWTAVELEALTSLLARTNLATAQSDCGARNSPATERLREAAKIWVLPAYNALEQARLAKPPECDPTAATRS